MDGTIFRVLEDIARGGLKHIMECVACGFEFDPIKTRWLCPKCKHKASCCEGAPLPEDCR